MGSKSLEKLNIRIILTNVIGFGLSVYAYLVERKLEEDAAYQPMCDFSEHAKCSLAFASEYGRGFGIVSEDSIFYYPNSLYGMLHFGLTTPLCLLNKPFSTRILLFLSILANISSVYFAYILYFILYDFCFVCVSIYAVNAAVLYFSYKKFAIMEGQNMKTD